jgi:hypothetical protein
MEDQSPPGRQKKEQNTKKGIKIRLPVKFTLEQAMKAHSESSRGINLFFL